MQKYKLTIALFIISILAFSLLQINIVQAKSPFEVEVGLSYSHSSNNRLNVSGYSVVEVVNVGRLEVRKIKRDILISQAKLRYNKPGYSIEAVIPIKTQRESIIKYADTTEEGEPVEELKTATGLGDIILNFQKKFKNRNDNFNLGIKTTTGQRFSGSNDISFGTGFYGLKVGYSKLKQIDPIVLFGSVNYFWNIEKNDVNPGDTIQYSLGLVYALTQNLSINTRIEHSITSSIYRSNQKVVGSSVNASSLYIGTNYANEEGSSVDFMLGIGLTEDSPDFSLQINKPYYF